MRDTPLAQLSCLLALTFCGALATAATSEQIHLEGSAAAESPTIKILRSDLDGITLQLEIPRLEKETVTIAGQEFQSLSIPGGAYRGIPGEAALPTLTRLVALPDGAGVQARVTDRQSRVLTGYHIAPHQPVQADKDQGDVAQLVKSTTYYGRQGMDDAPAVAVGQPSLWRGLRVVPITFQPVRYDPSRSEIEVTHSLTVTLDFNGAHSSNPTGQRAQLIPESFHNLYRQTVLNYDVASAQVGPGSYLVICPDNPTVITNLQPLLEWRRRQGYNVVLATTSQTGTSAGQIKSYIQNAYNNWEIPLEFVVLVGDANGTVALATWYESVSGYGGEGDHYYTTLAGSDVLPEVHIGRLTCRSATELATIVHKIVAYERDPWLDSDPGWFTRATLVGDPSSSGYSTIFVNQWCKEQLLDLNYTQIDTIWGGNFASLIQTSLNQGGTIFTYRGYWGMSGYTTGYIDALINGEKLPFAVTITCDTGSFADDSHARSEAFLRSANGGGVASIGMATLGTHTRFNNCLFNGIMEGVLNSGDFRTGPAQTRGKIEIFNNYNLWDPSTVETWCVWNNLMGDPATEIWTAEPTELSVVHPSNIAVGATSLVLDVTSTGGLPLAEARVALYKAGEIQVTGYTDANGNVMLPLTSQNAGELLVTVTKHNFKPYLGSLSIGTTDIYLATGDLVIDDDDMGQSLGNGDGVVNPGETIELGIEVTNLGTSSASAVTSALSSDDLQVTVLAANQEYGSLGPGETAVASFLVEVSRDTPDGYIPQLTLELSSADDTWQNLVELPVVAGACQATGFTFTGPGGRLEPGVGGGLSIQLQNTGSRDIAGATAILASETPWITVTDADGTYGPMNVGGLSENTTDPFGIVIAGDCYQGHLASFTITLDLVGGAEVTVEFQANVGTITAADPVGPDHYGYYAFDNTDAGYPFAPVYEWVEIDPSYGGNGTSLGLGDFGTYQDDTEQVDLPFTFKFYGEDFNLISVCSNGWFAFGNTYLKLYRNWTIPNAGGPDNLVAVFWDNLYMNSNSDVLTWHDTVNNRFIVEWSRMPNEFDGSLETFQAILYDPSHHPTDSGDGRIVCQYQTVNQVDWSNGFSTVGIQNNDHSDGLLYTYWNQYAGGAATLTSGRAIAFHPILPLPQGYLEGTVTNATAGGTPVGGAMVHIVESGRSIVSQESGYYYGSSPPGTFTVTIEHDSFLPVTVEGVEITVDQVTVQDFSLTDILGPYLDNMTQLGGTTDTNGPYEVQVNITDYSSVAEVHFHYTSSSDGGSTHELPLELLDEPTGLYRALIPGQPLGTRVQYWLTAADASDNHSVAPAGAPFQNYAFMVAEADIVLSDDMESDQGWTGGAAGDDAVSGLWVRVDPNGVLEGGTEIQPENDATPAPGVMCWITGNDPPGSAQGTDDVDGGRTTLLSPVFDLNSYTGVSLSYSRWYTNDTGNAPGQDYWQVEVTSDGTSWQTLENTNLSQRSWQTHSFLLEDVIALTSAVQVRFVAEDMSPGSVVEAGVDDFLLLGHQVLIDSATPTVTVLDPAGGETLPGGNTYTVTWNAGDDTGVVLTRVLFSTDSGASYPDTLAVGSLATSLEWEVPAITAATCRLKVEVLDALQSLSSDASDSDFAINSEPTDVEDLPVAQLALEQNRPNPFNPVTEIRFALPVAQRVNLRIYDVEGHLVRTLVDEKRPAGVHSVVWRGKDATGAQVASGLYFYRLLTEDGEVITRKMLLLK